MKNLINKVLVVLTVSAIFAGNIDAVRTNKKNHLMLLKKEEKKLLKTKPKSKK